jgi:hypothetical protein
LSERDVTGAGKRRRGEEAKRGTFVRGQLSFFPSSPLRVFPSWALLALALALALPGCLQGGLPLTPLSKELPAEPSSSYHYTWPAPVAFDAHGKPVASAALLDPARTPIGVEAMIPGSGGEPNVGVTPKGTIVVSSGDQTYRSTDQGKTWELAADLVGPLYPKMQDMFSSSDPDLWVDQDTGRIFVNNMNPTLECNYLQMSDGEGAKGTWTDRPFACTIPQEDHQKLMTAKPGPASPPLPLQGYPNVVYICVNKRLQVVGDNPLTGQPVGMGTSCMMSYDGGLTWPVERETYVNDQLCSNINGHPAAWPDGAVGMVLGNLGERCERPLTVVMSDDSGLTWTLKQCDKSLHQEEIDADITVTKDGTAYLLYRDLDQRVHLLRSKDKFNTCEKLDVAPPDVKLDTFTAITSGDDGRIAMAYLGTTDPQPAGATPSNATPGSVWHLYVTSSIDAESANPTFVTTQVTPDKDPVQVGCVWLGGGGGGPFRCRNLLDFIDMSHDKDGRWVISITDGCTPRNGCAGRVAESDDQSRDSEIGVVVEDRGESLYADKGVLPSVGLSWPAPETR